MDKNGAMRHKADILEPATPFKGVFVGEQTQLSLATIVQTRSANYFASGITMDNEVADLEWAEREPSATFPVVISETGTGAGVRRSALGYFQPSASYTVVKRFVDIWGTLALALLFSPIVLLVTLCLLRDGGPIIFKQTRIGKNGKAFKVFKFRTMVLNADQVLRKSILADPVLRGEWLRERKLKNDPRVTSIGKFLRRTSLDELPQLLNIMLGDMSLVGPRPIIREELRKYRRGARYYLAVKPGLTGLWQISGRNDMEYKRRVAMDRRYVCRASIQLDLVILSKTVLVVLGRRGAY